MVAPTVGNYLARILNLTFVPLGWKRLDSRLFCVQKGDPVEMAGGTQVCCCDAGIWCQVIGWLQIVSFCNVMKPCFLKILKTDGNEVQS